MPILSGGQIRLPITDESTVVECRKRAKILADRFRFDEVSAGRIAIIATELAGNVLRHAGGGYLLIQVLDDGTTAEFEVLAIDDGPGMHDPDECLEEGYSSTGAAGQGLGVVSRLSNTFDLHSRMGHGTVVLSRTERKRERARSEPRRTALEIGAVSVMPWGDAELRHCWCVAEEDALVSMMLAEGMGPGPAAATAANVAVGEFARLPFEDPAITMRFLHAVLRGSGGATASCARLDASSLSLTYSAIGATGCRVITRQRSRRLAGVAGTLGGVHPTPGVQRVEAQWPLGSRVVMHSGCLASRWSIGAYPGLHLRHSALIAAVLSRDFAHRTDAATVLVVCHR